MAAPHLEKYGHDIDLRPDGPCRTCYKIWREKNREYINEQMRRYRADHPGYFKAFEKRRLPRKRETLRAWRAANPEKTRAYEARKDPVKRREQKRASRLRNLERERERDRNRPNNRERGRSGEMRTRATTTPGSRSGIRRTLRRGGPAVVVARQNAWGCPFTTQGRTCRCKCLPRRGAAIGAASPHKKRYHVDHVIPLSKGGSDGRENIVISCPSCNMSKKDKMPEVFAGRLL